MIKGFLGTTLIDYPGKIASIVYTAGCNFFCPFCYNKRLILSDFIENSPIIYADNIIEELDQRKGFIEGVVITGGEPLIHHHELKEFIEGIKSRTQLSVKLDTNGSFPQRLRELLQEKLIDYVAMDLKCGFSKYSSLCNIDDMKSRIHESMEYIREAGIEFEWRTTVAPGFFTGTDIEQISSCIEKDEDYYLQCFAPITEELVDPDILEKHHTTDFNELKNHISVIEKKGVSVMFRGFDQNSKLNT